MEAYLTELTVQDIHWLQSLAGRPNVEVKVIVPLTLRTARSLPAAAQAGLVIQWADVVHEPDALAQLDQLWLRTIDEIIEGRDLSPLTRRALMIVRSRIPAPRSVQDLAGDLAVTPRVLRYYWRRDGVGPPIKQFLSWNLLIRAVRLARTESWERTAFRLRVHRRTLERLSQRLVNQSLARVPPNARTATEILEKWVRSHL